MDFLIGALAGAVMLWLWFTLRRMINRWKFRQYDIADTANQLRFIEAVNFYPRRPINSEAYKIFSLLEQHLKQKRWKWRLLAEVSMGAFIGTSNETGTDAERKRAFKSINSKRIDFLIIDSLGNPAVAVEYQGSGHHLDDKASARDAVKKRALERAGIELLEIYEHAHDKEILTSLDAMLYRHMQAHK